MLYDTCKNQINMYIIVLHPSIIFQKSTLISVYIIFWWAERKRTTQSYIKNNLHNQNSATVFLRMEAKQNHNQDSAERDTEPNYWKLGRPA